MSVSRWRDELPYEPEQGGFGMLITGLVLILCWLTFWGAVVYAGVHFVRKYW